VTRARVLVALSLIVFSTAACGGGGGESRPADRDVIASLQDRGLKLAGPTFEPSGPLGVASTVYRIGKSEVHVFRFGSGERAREAAAGIGADGYTIVTKSVAVQADWFAPPHWFRAGREIVLFLGTDDEVMDGLEEAAGPQFAGS